LISSDCAIEALHLTAKSSHPLKNDIFPFIAILGSNSLLTELDITGHQIANKGAIQLAKSLQTNSSLVKVMWDGNQTGLMGFKNIKYALTMNKTLKYFPLPVADIGAELQLQKAAEDHRKLQKALAKIEQLILHNQLRN